MFRNDFLWGAGASAYQIEGAVNEDGRGASVWDEFCEQPGKVFEGHSGKTACDFYHRYPGDIALMKEMGLKSYRFSLAWPRIMPEGTGRVEKRGIEFYRKVFAQLHQNGIIPFVGISIWDYPAALMHRGGWLNPDSPRWFEDYTRVVAEELGDCFKYAATFNEPQMMFGNTFVLPNLAPGWRMADGDVIRMIHNMLIAHGLCVKVLREKMPHAVIGVTNASDPVIPPDEKPETLAAVRRLYYKAGDDMQSLSFGLSWYADPVFLGKYPEDGLEKFGRYLPAGWEKDMPLINQSIDFFGHNIYTGIHADINEKGEAVQRPNPVGFPRTAYDWTIKPECLYWGVRLPCERYKVPVIITENGMSCHDAISLDGGVHDPNRIDYLHRHLLQLKRAVDEGFDVRGYYHWSFTDNFEWACGYNQRFGLIYIDYQTQERIRKDSSYWYQKVMETNGAYL